MKELTVRTSDFCKLSKQRLRPYEIERNRINRRKFQFKTSN